MRDGLRGAFAAWLKVQASDVIRLAERILGVRRAQDSQALMEALERYYEEAAMNLPSDLKAAVRKVCELAKARLAKDLPDAGAITQEWLEEHVQGYYSEMGKRLCKANLGEIERLVSRVDSADIIDALIAKLTNWPEKRARQMAANEIMFALNNTLIAGYARAGYTSIWKGSSAECPACQALNGQTITVLRPPLHKGCMCSVAMGEKIDGAGRDGLTKKPLSATITIAGREVPFKIVTQKQAQHIPGAMEWKRRIRENLAAGRLLPSTFKKGLNPVDLLDMYAGTGLVCHPSSSDYPEEYIQLEGIVGRTFLKNERRYVNTRRICIRYSSQGAHMFPVREVNGDAAET